MGKAKPIIIDPKILEHLKSQLETGLFVQAYNLSQLGAVHCMDVLKFLRMLPNNSVDIIFTDEPYGVESSIISFTSRKAMSTEFEWDDPLPYHLVSPWVYEAYRVLKNPGTLLNFGIASWNTTFEQICIDAGFTFRAHNVWIKTNPPPRIRKGGFRSAHEMLWVASKGTLKDSLTFSQVDLLNYNISATCPNCGHEYSLMDSQVEWPDDEIVSFAPFKHHGHRVGHETEKQPWIIQKYIWLATKPGDVLVDPFSGSGEIIVQAKRYGCEIIANDINPKWKPILEARLNSIQQGVFTNDEEVPEV